MVVNVRFAATLFFIGVTMVGCRGGSGAGGGGVLPPFTPSNGSGTASFTVALPYQAPASSGAGQSMVVSLMQINGAAPTVAVTPVKLNLSPSSPGCSLAAGTLKCTASIAVPSGTDTFSVATFSQPNGAGTQVSISQTTTPISPGKKILCTKKAGNTPATSTPRTI